MSRTWEDNAAEFGQLSKQGTDLRLAALVACSVEKGKGNGGDRKSDQRGDRPADPAEKVGAAAFARAAGTSHKRIGRHLTAWEALAERGLVVRPSDLTPANVNEDRLLLADIDAVLEAFDEVYDATDAGSRPRAPISEIDGALANRDGYAARLITGLSDEGFTALVEAIEETTAATVPEVDPDLPEPPPAKPTKKRAVVDDWAARKAKQDLAERQARLDAELQQIKLDAIARGGKVPAPSAKDPITMESMFGERFTAWSELTQVLADAARRLTAFRETYGDLLDEETTVLRASAVGLLDIAAGTHRFTEVGGVVPR